MSHGRWKTDDKPKSSDRADVLKNLAAMGHAALADEIADALEKAVWKPVPTDDPYHGRFWEGRAGRCFFVVADFELGSQGYDGYRAADGTVTVGFQVVRLGHELSEHAVSLAVAQNPNA